MEDHEVKEETEVTLDVNDNKKKKKSKKDKKKEPEPRVPLKELFRYATGVDYALMFFGSLGGIAQGAIMPSFALVFGLVLDAFNDMGPGFLDRVLEVALYFLYAGIGALFVTYAQTGFWNWTSARQNNVIRNEYLKAILRQEVAWFDQTPSGELTTRIVSDTIIIQEAMGEKIGTFLQYMSTGITGFILGFTKSWKLSLVMFAVTPLLAACGAFMVKILAQITTRGQKEYAKAGAFASETISGVRTIASFASEPIAADKYKVSLTEAKNLGIRGGLVSGVGIGVTLFVFFGVYGLALWYGSTLVADGEISGGDVLTVFFSVLLGAFALGQASPSMEALAKGQGAAYKIFTTIDRQTAIDPSLQTGERLEKVIGNIKFSDVCFTYPNRAEHTVFRGLNIDIKAGEKVAFVGHSGSGKSTTIQMILRFYDPDAGTVTLDGQNIKDFNLYWYRNQIGLVGQEPVLFTGTIAENIAYGKPGATQEEIEEAAKMSNAHKFIQTFPDGYNTQVGEKGAQLSGGQKQRIAIARAIIKNPKILLLDEATSALDTESEKVVQDALDSVMGGRTTIIVAHRLATIRDANKILVISKGVVAEQGNHDELMEKKGLYYDLVQSQTGGVTYEKKEKKKQNDEKKVETEIEAQKTEVDESSVDIKSVKFSRILALNKPEAKFLVMGCIAAAFNGAVQPVFSILFSEMVALFYMPPDVIRADSWKWAIGFAAIGFVPLT